MGWSSGSEIAAKVWDTVADHIPPGERHQVALGICHIFEDEDCDTLAEASDLYAAAYPPS